MEMAQMIMEAAAWTALPGPKRISTPLSINRRITLKVGRGMSGTRYTLFVTTWSYQEHALVEHFQVIEGSGATQARASARLCQKLTLFDSVPQRIPTNIRVCGRIQGGTRVYGCRLFDLRV